MKFIPAAQTGFVPASHEDPRNPGVLKRVIATAAQFQAGHVQMLNWARLPGLSSFQPHYHEDMQEIFVLLTGQVEMQVSGHAIPMTTGDTMVVEPGEIHVMRNLDESPAEYLVFGISSGKGGRTVVV